MVGSTTHLKFQVYRPIYEITGKMRMIVPGCGGYTTGSDRPFGANVAQRTAGLFYWVGRLGGSIGSGS